MAGLFQLNYFVLELFGKFVVVDAVGGRQRPDHLALILSMHRSAIALPGTCLAAFLTFSCRSDVLHGVSGVGGVHVFWLRMLPSVRILILATEASMSCLS